MWKITWIQLMNRWRSNVWVCVELLLAFCLAWYMADYFFVEIYNRSLPSGRGYADVWPGRDGPLAGNLPRLSSRRERLDRPCWEIMSG